MGAAGLSAYEEQIRQNMVLFDRARKMFSPFGFPQGGAAATGEPAKAGEAAPAAAEGEPLDELKKQMAAMQAQLEKLASKG
jgi:polyhydroxyalkanoate synthesis regulator protein